MLAYTSMLGFHSYTTPFDAIVTSLALKYLGVLYSAPPSIHLSTALIVQCMAHVLCLFQGEEGVSQVLQMLRDELKQAMILCG